MYVVFHVIFTKMKSYHTYCFGEVMNVDGLEWVEG